ncbi:hypothetical protein TrLO_g6626 [Triparma laevis f. longispina]|uniref:Uncharacterized protein n=1 Tax=Triparma laevis f. longispina TaxID=1714387 RepID=A0A9W6ZLA4_9STRA|nr:hypothetical protein TrLO_g6626 [Triparma laevis f. longispina]
MSQCLLLGVGDLIQHFKSKDSPTPEEENGDVNVETEFALSASFYLLLGSVFVPILALRLSKGNQNLGDETKISESVVRKTLYAHYPEAVAASALCISYLIAESTGCLFREGNYYVCSDVIASNSAFSILFVIEVIHKGFVEPFRVSSNAAFMYTLLPTFCFLWSLGLIGWYFHPDFNNDTNNTNVEPLRKAGLVLLILFSTLVFFPVHELAAKHLIEYLTDVGIQNHMVMTFNLALSIFGPCIFLVTESGTCVMTKSLASCEAFTKTSTVVETHLLLALVFVQTFGFLFKKRTIGDIAHLENVKLHELFLWGSFTVNTILTVLVFGMRPRDPDDYNLENNPVLELSPDPTATFANVAHYFIVFIWIGVLWLESLYLRAINKKNLQLRFPSMSTHTFSLGVDGEREEWDTFGDDEEEGRSKSDSSRSITSSLSRASMASTNSIKNINPPQKSPRSYVKRQQKTTRRMLRNNKSEEPVIARAHQFFLLTLAIIKPTLSLVSIFCRGLGINVTATVLSILVNDFFEICGVSAILYMFCDLSEGKKYKRMAVAISIPGGQVLELIARHQTLSRTFFTDQISIRIVVYATLTAYVSSRCYKTMLNVIEDVQPKKLKKLIANIVFGSMFTYLPPLMYIAMEHVSCVWRLWGVEPLLFERHDMWDTRVICVSSYGGCKSLLFHIGMTGMFSLNFSPKWEDMHRGYFLSLKKIITLRMKVPEAVVFVAYVLATFNALLVYGTRDRGWGDTNLIEMAVNITRAGELPAVLGPDFPIQELIDSGECLRREKCGGGTGMDFEDNAYSYTVYFTYAEYLIWVFIFSFQYWIGDRSARLAKESEKEKTQSKLQVCPAFALDHELGEGEGGKEDEEGKISPKANPKGKRKKRLTAKYDPPKNVELTSKEKRLEVGDSKSIWDGGTKGVHRSSSGANSSFSVLSPLSSRASLAERTSQQERGTVFGKKQGLEGGDLDHVVEEDEGEEDQSNFMDNTGFTLGPGIV